MTENATSSKRTSRKAKTPAPTSPPVETSSEQSAPQSQMRAERQPDTPIRTEADIQAEVAALFEEEPQSAPQSAEDTPAPEPPSEPEAPLSEEPDEGPVMLSDVADSLEVDAKDLYEIQIPIGDNETVSLGAMKDAYKAVTETEREHRQHRDQLAQISAAQAQDGVYLQNTLEALRPQLTPELMQYVGDHNRRVDREEAAALHRMIPELGTQAGGAAFREKLVKRMASVTGATEAEALARINRYRGRGAALDIKFLHAAVSAFEELDRLKGVRTEAERQTAPKTKRPGGPRGKSDRLSRALKRASGGTEADKTAAVAMLIGGQE